MPRSLRLITERECYHVINRANSGQLIFDSPFAYHEYLTLLEKYAKKFNVLVYHYVLMPNHVHLLVEPTNDDLPFFMQGITLTHTQRVHRRNKTHGHLWQGRYKNLHIDKDAYFLQCGNYIELNPVRAGIVATPSEYPWSSYHAYANGSYNSILTFDQFYLDLGRTPEDRQIKYRQLVTELSQCHVDILKEGG